MQLCISKNNKVWHKLQGRSRKVGVARAATSSNIEILQVSANGMEVIFFMFFFHALSSAFCLQVEIFRPHDPAHNGPSASPEHDGFYLHACYTYHDLPSRYWKRYQYVSEFVNVVRSKTPKVTLFTDQAKCTLMENGPNPDYQVYFYNGEC